MNRESKIAMPKRSEDLFAETRPSLCNGDLISGALLLGEPAESHQGKYEGGK